jgi:hypothetical protein
MLIALAFGSMLVHPCAAASDEGAFAFHGGATLPLGALADSTGTGYAVGFGGGARLGRRFLMDVDLTFSHPGTTGEEGLAFSNLMLGVRGRYEPFGWGPGLYLLTGQGLVDLIIFTFTGSSTGDVGLRLGVSGGAGVVLAAGPNLELALEGTAHHIFHHSEIAQLMPQGSPIQFANVTLRLSFVHHRQADVRE